MNDIAACQLPLKISDEAAVYLLRGTPEQVDRRLELLRRQNNERNRRMLEDIARSKTRHEGTP